MIRDMFTAYCQERAGIILAEQVTSLSIYNGYAAYCRKQGVEPLTYKELETRCDNVIWSYRIKWREIEPHVAIRYFGEYFKQ